MNDPAAEQKKAEQRGQQALSLAFQEALTENATLRIGGKAKDLLIQELQAENAQLRAQVPKEEPEAPKPKRTRRKTGNGAAAQATA